MSNETTETNDSDDTGCMLVGCIIVCIVNFVIFQFDALAGATTFAFFGLWAALGIPYFLLGNG